MAQLVARRIVREGLNRILSPAGYRIVTSTEELAAQRRYQGAVRQLHDAYACLFAPALRARLGRVELLCQLRGTDVAEAMVLLYHLQESMGSGDGDICEMGVAQGATSALIANEIVDDASRRLWLYDSFQGLSAPTDEDELVDDIFGLGSMDRYAKTMAHPVEELTARLRQVGFPQSRTRIVAGYIEPTLPPSSLPEAVAFAYLDFDLYEPTRTGLRLLHDRCRPGSVLMVDDYGYFSSGPKAAVTEFIKSYPDAYDFIEPPPGAGGFCVLRRR